MCLCFLKGKTKSAGPFSEILPSLAPAPPARLRCFQFVPITLWVELAPHWPQKGSPGSMQPFQYPFQVCPVVSPAYGASPISAFLTWDPSSLVEPVRVVGFSCQHDTI